MTVDGPQVDCLARPPPRTEDSSQGVPATVVPQGCPGWGTGGRCSVTIAVLRLQSMAKIWAM
jgi:hypothetical protein